MTKMHLPSKKVVFVYFSVSTAGVAGGSRVVPYVGRSMQCILFY